MPQAIFTPFPQVLPTPTPPQDYQRIESSPADFGGLMGAAEERAGPQLSQAGSELTNTYSQLSAQQEQTTFTNRVNAMLYGDPANPTDKGLFGLTGQAYMDKRQEVLKGMNDAQQESMGRLPTTQGQVMFNNESRFYISRMQAEIGRGYEQASREWAGEVHKNESAAALSDAANNYNQSDAVVQNLARMNRSSHQSLIDSGILPADMTNATPDQVTIANNTYRENEALLARTTFNAAIAHNDTAGAQQILQSHSAALASDPHYPTMVQELKTRGTAAIGADILNHAQGNAAAAPAAPPGSSTIPPAATAPDQYKPLIDKAAAQYQVPPELITRVLSAENGFRATGVSSAGAQGIAQFMPATAAQYGVNPNDPTSAIPGAAHYLADLHAQKGSWHAALTGYLGGDPKNDPSYTRAGAWQYADQLDSGGGGAAPTAGAAPASTGQAVSPIAIGDSIARGFQKFGGAGGTGKDLDASDTTAAASGGRSPSTILSYLQSQPDGSLNGQPVIFSTGVSNGPGQVNLVPQQLAELKRMGAGPISVVGVGTQSGVEGGNHYDLNQYNGQIASDAKNAGATFLGGLPAVVHPAASYYAGAMPAASPGVAGQTVTPPNFDTQHAPGMVTPGNVDPWNRPVLHNADGSYSTTSSMSIGTDAGEVLIPTVINGKRLSSDDAIAHFKQTGENLGTFSTPAQADTYATALHNAQASMFDVQGRLTSAGAPQAQQIPTAIPSVSTSPTPAASPPPGMADLSQTEAELAKNHARVVSAIVDDPRTAQNPDAGQHALALADKQFQSKQMAITAQKNAIIEQRNATADGILQAIRKSPNDAAAQQQISDQITSDPNLDLTSRNILRAQQAEILKGTVLGASQDFGPGYFDVVKRMNLPPDNPNRISDYSQLLSMTQPDDTGFRWLSEKGLDQAGKDLAGAKKDSGDLQIKEAQLAALKSYLTFDGVDSQRDPKGMASYARVMPIFQQYWDSPQRLQDQAKSVNPTTGESPLTAAVFALANPVKRTDAQFQKDFMQATDTAAAQTAATIKAPGDLAAAISNGTLTKQQAEQIGISRGWIVPRTAPDPVAPQPMPPMQ